MDPDDVADCQASACSASAIQGIIDQIQKISLASNSCIWDVDISTLESVKSDCVLTGHSACHDKTSSASSLLFINKVAELWMYSLGERVLRKKMSKVLDKCYQCFPDITEKCLDQAIDSMLSEKNVTSALKRLSLGLESCTFIYNCIERQWTKCLLFILGGLDLLTKSQEKNTNSTEAITSDNRMNLSGEATVLITKVFLQLAQFLPAKMEWSLMMYEGNILSHDVVKDDQKQAMKILQNILTAFLTMLQSKDTTKDAVIFIGTSLALLLNSYRTSEDAISSIWPLFYTQGKEPKYSNIGGISLKMEVKDDPNPYWLMALTNGFVNTSRQDILLHPILANEEMMPFVTALLPTISTRCRLSKNPGVKFFSFTVLSSWLQSWKRISSSRSLFSCDSQDVQQIIHLCYDNAEDIVDGVPQLVQNVFSSLLSLLSDDIGFPKLISTIILQKLKTPWFVKGKYGFLSQLVPYLTQDQLFMVSNEIAYDICSRCMATCTLPSTSNELHKALVSAFSGKAKNEVVFLDWWSTSWMFHILGALESDNAVCRRNNAHYMLPWTLENYPSTFSLMKSQFKDVSTLDNDRSYSYSVITKFGRKFGVIQGKDVVGDDDLVRNLCHSDDEVRIEAYAAITVSPKRTEALSKDEVHLILAFIRKNLTCAQSSFRQQLFVLTKDLLLRVRDSCAVLHRKIRQTKEEKTTLLYQTLELPMTLLDGMVEMTIQALFPGGSFQRRRTALQLILILIEVFHGKGKHSKSTNESLTKVLAWMKAENHLDLFSARNLMIVTSCLEDQHDEVREAALKILTHSSIDENVFCSVLEDFSHRILHVCCYMLSSPKAQEAESGASLFEFVTVRLILERGMKLECHGDDKLTLLSPNKDDKDSDDVTKVIVVIQLLLTLYKKQLEQISSDILKGSVSSPGFGYLVAVRRLVSLVSTLQPHLRSDCNQLRYHLVEDITTCCRKAHLQMLGILSSTPSKAYHEEDISPSFADIREALDVVLQRSSSYESYCNLIGPQQSRELVLSMAWLNLKSIVLLLSELPPMLQGLEIQNSNSFTKTIHAIGEIFHSCLVKCRHKGVIESGYAALAKFCKSLRNNVVFEVQMKRWLEDIMNSVTSGSMKTSITKRSAGVPLFIQSVLSALSKDDSDETLATTIKTLMTVAEEPVQEIVDQSTDLPQVHAINIIKALFRDTSLGGVVLEFAERAVRLTVAGFSSPVWSIRNACTLLLGTLLPRMLGQKMTQTDSVQQNAFSCREFFMKCPSLEDYFSKCLTREDSNDGRIALVSPQLLPVLTFLSKLRISSTGNESIKSADSFVEKLLPLLQSSVYVVRNLAARSLLSFISADNFLCVYSDLLHRICVPIGSANLAHGLLLLYNSFLDNVQISRNPKEGTDHERACGVLRDWIRWSKKERNEFITTSALLDCVSVYLDRFAGKRDTSNDNEMIFGFITNAFTIAEGKLQNASSLIGYSYLLKKLSSVVARILLKYEMDDTVKELLLRLQRSKASELYCLTLDAITGEIKNGTKLQPSLATILSEDLLQIIMEYVDDWSTHSEFLRVCVQCLSWVLPKASLTLDPKQWKDLLVKLLVTKSRCTLTNRTLPEFLICISIVIRFILHNHDFNDKNIDDQCLCAIDLCVDLQDRLCCPSMIEDLRLAVAQSLQLTLEGFFQLWKCKSNVQLFRVFKSAIRLLDDEDELIRKAAAQAVTQIDAEKKGLAGSLRGEDVVSARHKLFGMASSHLWDSPELIDGLVNMLFEMAMMKEDRGPLPSELLRSCLFHQEGPNLYAEPHILTTEIIRCLLEVASKVVKSWEEIELKTQTRLSEVFRQRFMQLNSMLENQITCLKTADFESDDRLFGNSGNPRTYSSLKCFWHLIPVYHLLNSKFRGIFGLDITPLTEYFEKVSLMHPLLNDEYEKAASHLKQK